MIRRCNDFGAGGVSVAIGELADGLDINLNAVPKKYDGLDGTELAISESQERMAVVVAKENVEKFIEMANEENIEATVVAVVTDTNRLRMTWNGNTIVDVSRDFLNTNGCFQARRGRCIARCRLRPFERSGRGRKSVKEKIAEPCPRSLNICLERGLAERFDGSIGASSVFMPYRR